MSKKNAEKVKIGQLNEYQQRHECSSTMLMLVSIDCTAGNMCAASKVWETLAVYAHYVFAIVSVFMSFNSAIRCVCTVQCANF